MEEKKGLIKYYLFFALLLIVTALAVGYTMTKSSAAKADAKTSAKVIETAKKLDSYVHKNSQLPATLDDAGVNSLPATITYSKIDDGSYKFCASYNNGASVNIASITNAIPPILNQSIGGSKQASGDEAVDTYKLVTVHKSGQNCQTLKSAVQSSSAGLNISSSNQATGSASTSTDNPNPNGLLSAKCGTSGKAFELKDVATVQSVDSGQGVIILNSTTAKVTDKNVVPVKTLTSIKYDPVTSVYTVKCKKASIEDVGNLKPGATITVYLYNHDSSYADQIEI